MTMNYETKYKQALSRATFYNNELLTENQRKMLLDIFPELTMSEDERIRKALIEMIHDTTGDECEDCYHVSKESVLAWLEKQGEKKNTRKREIDDAYLQGICDAKHEIEKQGEQLNGIIEPRKVYADKVIAWLKTKVYDDSAYGMAMIEQFKKDFSL